MLGTTGDRINWYRGRVQWLARGAGFLLVIVGGYLVLKRLIFAFAVGSYEAAFEAYMGVGEEHSAYRGLAMIVVGVALVTLASRVARWIISIPPDGCPRCGHPTPPDGPPERCTECAFRW